MADKRKKATLTEIERNNVAQWLLQNSKDFKLRYDAKKEAAAMFNIDVRTVWRLWTAARAQKMMGRPVQLVSMKKGSTHSDKKVIDVEKVKQLSVLERSTIRKMANKLEVSKSLVGVWIKEKKIRAHTNAIKPLLTQQNRLSRLTWSLSQLSAISANGRIKFQPMYNTIHIDEKWFYLTKTSDRYYLLPDEIEPYRACKSKRFIEKIMFICVVSRPQYDNEGKMIFDGKFGIFPFTTVVPAVRNNKNRMRGTIKTVSGTTVSGSKAQDGKDKASKWVAVKTSENVGEDSVIGAVSPKTKGGNNKSGDSSVESPVVPRSIGDGNRSGDSSVESPAEQREVRICS
ncbi:uncharacterized protein LOC131018097 [Salvia miltiorrhiza]|uniref:uncharacterized protein LOC131018097 n=1 Tax=Salvia miltiorrhiza TaxID=226208 RepID=UPI0025ACD733|nr:uncharacterized protein LOC131018097 [Salvia miltiorrhiza]